MVSHQHSNDTATAEETLKQFRQLGFLFIGFARFVGNIKNNEGEVVGINLRAIPDKERALQRCQSIIKIHNLPLEIKDQPHTLFQIFYKQENESNRIY